MRKLIGERSACAHRYNRIAFDSNRAISDRWRGDRQNPFGAIECCHLVLSSNSPVGTKCL